MKKKTMPKVPDRVLVGSYNMGAREVQLWALPNSSGGSFVMAPPNGIAFMEVGLDQRAWQDVVGVMLHEAMELCMTDMQCRYHHAPDFSNDLGSLTFIMTHAQFSEANQRAAMYAANCLPDLSAAYKKYRTKNTRTW